MSVLSREDCDKMRAYLKTYKGSVGPDADGDASAPGHEDCERDAWDLLDTIDRLRVIEEVALIIQAELRAVVGHGVSVEREELLSKALAEVNES